MQRLSTCITPVSSFLSTNSVAVWNCDSAALFSFLSIDMMDVVKRCIERVKFGGAGRKKKEKKKGGVASDKTKVARAMKSSGDGKQQMKETSSRREHSD